MPFTLAPINAAVMETNRTQFEDVEGDSVWKVETDGNLDLLFATSTPKETTTGKITFTATPKAKASTSDEENSSPRNEKARSRKASI